MHTAEVDVGEPEAVGVADAGDKDALCLLTTWLILVMGWDSSCNTVEASLGQHSLEISLLCSRAYNVGKYHTQLSTSVTIIGMFFLVWL